MFVCLVAVYTTHAPREPGFDTLDPVLCFWSPCCAGQRSVYASGLGMWLQEGCTGQASGVVGGTSVVVEAGNGSWVRQVLSHAKATSFWPVKVFFCYAI